MKIIASLRDPVERCISAYFNKAADGTLFRHMQRHLYEQGPRGVEKRSDSEVLALYQLTPYKLRQFHGERDKKRPLVPSLMQVISELNATMAKCPVHAWHYTLAEKPHSNPSPPACYVSPFVLHGYYGAYF